MLTWCLIWALSAVGSISGRIDVDVEQDKISFIEEGKELSTEFKTDIGTLYYISAHHIRPKDISQASFFGGLHSLVITPNGHEMISIGQQRHFVELRVGDPKSDLRIDGVSLYEMNYVNGSSMVGNSSGWDSPGGLAAFEDKGSGSLLVAYSHYLLKFTNGVASTESEMIDTQYSGGCVTGGAPLAIHSTGKHVEELVILCEAPNDGSSTVTMRLVNLVKKESKTFHMEILPGIQPVDLTRLPNGDFLVLSHESFRGGVVSIGYMAESDITTASSSKNTLKCRNIAMLNGTDGYKIKGMNAIVSFEDPATRRTFIYTLSDSSLHTELPGTVIWAFEWIPSPEASNKGIMLVSLIAYILAFVCCGFLLAVSYKCCRRTQMPSSLQRLRPGSGRRILGRRSAAADYYRGEFSSSDDDDEFELAAVPIGRNQE